MQLLHQTLAGHRVMTVTVVVVLLMSACGFFGSGDPMVACSITGDDPFDPALLAGPALDRSGLLDTAQGRVLEAFFVGGDGEP